MMIPPREASTKTPFSGFWRWDGSNKDQSFSIFDFFLFITELQYEKKSRELIIGGSEISSWLIADLSEKTGKHLKWSW